jgi:hypothetical protein
VTIRLGRRLATAAVAVLALVASALSFAPAPAEAANAADFQPGYIISDSIFFNSSLMSEQQVQSFLESTVPTCAATAGNPGCLRDYRSDSSPRAADAHCAAYPGGTNQLASTIIVAVARACNINPQVILATLQKEQGLVTSVNPSATKYKIAMGYGCPDTAACDSLYFGFANQVYSASRQFIRYGVPSLNFRYQAGRDNQISWHPNAGCGSSTVFIENRATAALYNYTPYRPNQAALSNLYGTGDGCSSYGNRNFWKYFSDWFGSPIVTKAADSFVQAVYQDVLSRPASDGERINWGKALMSGMPPSQVAGAFVNSDEFRLLKIDAAYREVLGREPEESGRMAWLGGMRSGALAPDDAYRIFMQSQEYYNGVGGTDEAFVAAVYERIIGRPAVAEEVAYWQTMMTQYGRADVVDLIWFSVETARTRVAGMYRAYLGREPDWAGLIQWGDYALRYGDTWVRSAILGGDEYWNRAGTRYP